MGGPFVTFDRGPEGLAMAASTKEQGGIRAALAYRDFRWLVTGLAASSVGSWAYNVALYVYVWDATGSATWAAATTLGRFVPALLFSTYGGVVAERVERRRLLIRLDLLASTVMITLALVTGMTVLPLLAIVLASLSSMIGTVYWPATAALTPQIVDEKDLAAANAFQSMIENVSVIVGPALGALVLAVYSVPVTLLINAALFLFSAWCSTRLRTRSTPSDVTEGGSAGVVRQVVVGFRAVTSSTTAAILVGASVLASFFYGVDTVLFVVVSDQRLGLGPDGFGVLVAGLGVGGIAMSPVVNRLAGSRRLASIISFALVVYTLPTLLLLWVDAAAGAFAIQVVRGAGTLVVDVLAVTALQRSLPSDMIARVFGVFTTLVLGAISLGALVVPLVLGVAGLDGTLVVFSVGASVLIVILYPFTRTVDREMAERLTALAPRIEVLAGLGIFASASRTALERLASAAEERRVGAGSRIITQGDAADAFYVVLEGAVSVSRATDAGGVEHLQDLGPAQYFGEVGLLEEVPRTAHVDARTDVEVLRVPGDDFIAALTEAAATPAFMETARMRLASTNPARPLTGRALSKDEDVAPR